MKSLTNKLSKNRNSFLGMFLFIACLLSNFDQQASAQSTCSTAIAISPSSTPPTTDYQFTDSITWFSFVAGSANTVVIITGPSNTLDSTAQLSSLALYGGSCSSLTLIYNSPLDSNNILVPLYIYRVPTSFSKKPFANIQPWYISLNF
jgi:hypothetical protein